MAIEDDVLVVGGGIAGMTAALAAAERGATVRLARRKRSTLRLATGLADVLGYVDGRLLSHPFERLEELPKSHPYSFLGRETIRKGLDRFDAVTGEGYAGNHTGRNAIVMTQSGNVKPTFRYPKSMAAGLASDRQDVLLVGFERIVDFDPLFVASQLRKVGVPFDVRGETLPFPLDFPSDATRLRYARALDTDESKVRDQLATRLRSRLDGEPRVGIPAVLGLEKPDTVRRSLSKAVDADVFEIPTGPPSVPGIRLERMFRTALDEAGVTVVHNPVVDYEARGNVISAAILERYGQPIRVEATQFVLASGGLVGKGLVSDRDAIREPVFGCHVPQPSERTAWYVEDRHGNQPFSRFGVDVDEELHPVSSSGSKAFENLRAAGSVLGGFDFAETCSGTGISLTTGERAGRLAGGEIR